MSTATRYNAVSLERIDPRQKSGADVRRMFDAIAPRYDLLNRVLSAGVDVRWRRRAVARSLEGRPADGSAAVLDVCCGTGDLAFEFARDARVGRVIGVDFAARMVGFAARKAARRPPRRTAASPSWFVGDALQLPFADRSFDVASVAFGLRNVVLPARGLAEIARTLKPGGRLVVLEFFAPPDGPGARAFRLYFRHVLPCIGRLVTGAAGVDAYRYLPDSVEAFARPEQVAGWLTDCGLIEPRCERFLFGAVALLSARRAPARQPAPDGVPAPCFAGA